jgi:Family of unknown function (DUF6011)
MHTTTQEGTMELNTDTRAGRMLQGLLASTNRRAKVQLTVSVTGQRAHHQDFRVKAWTGRDGTRMLTFDLCDGDYAAGTYSTKVLHVNAMTGQASPARGYSDALVLYMARAALQYMAQGTTPQPANGTVQVQEHEQCGCCGLRLTHPASIELGIGPECASKVGLAHHYGGSTKAATRKAAAPAAAAPRDTTVAEDAGGDDGSNLVGGAQGQQDAVAEWQELYEDELAAMPVRARRAATQAARDAAGQGLPLPSPVQAPAATPQAIKSAAIIELQRTEQRLQRTYDDANRACNFDAAQAARDALDECRGTRAALQAELRSMLAPA